MSQENRRSVSDEKTPELKTIVGGMRDTALDVAARPDDDRWLTMTIEWRSGEAKATFTNLGSGCLSLSLNTDTISSNGVHAVSKFEISVQDDVPSKASEAWQADWTVPAPGSSFGERKGDEVVDQLEAEVGRFISPIAAHNVVVTID